MNKNLLLISENSQDQEFLAEVAKITGLNVNLIPNPEQAIEIIVNEAPGAIFIDASTSKLYEKFEKTVQESVGLFSDKINPNAIHYIGAEDLEKLSYISNSPLFGHFVSRNYGNVADSGRHYSRVIHATLGKRPNGLKDLIDPGVKIQTVKLHNTLQKLDAVDAIRDFALAAKFQTRMASVIANAVDEILMNAMFDAPVDELGRPLYRTTPRSTELKLENRAVVEMHVGFDGQYLGVTAVDQFGSLDKTNLLSHISKLYTEEEYKVKTSVASAGIGLATVYHSGASLFFCCESRVRTEISVFFKKSESFRDFRDQFRFISTQFYF